MSEDKNKQAEKLDKRAAALRENLQRRKAVTKAKAKAKANIACPDVYLETKTKKDT